MLFVIEVMEGMGAFLVGGCFFQCRGSSFQDRRSAMTDSTIAPPPNRRFSLSNVSWSWFMASRHEEGCYEKRVLIRFHVRKGLSNDDVGAARDTVVQEIRPGAGFKTGDFVNETLGGLYRRTTLINAFDTIVVYTKAMRFLIGGDGCLVGGCFW